MKLHIILLTAAILCTSATAMCKKPNLKNTRWSSEYMEFVADAGNATVTITLDFVSAKEFEMKTVSVMPSYPASYVNPDGTIDRLPGFSREYTVKGTYSVNKNVVKLTSESAETYTLNYVSGKLETDNLTYQHLEFTREEKK